MREKRQLFSPDVRAGIIWAGWAGLLLVFYYRQIWRLPALGLWEWVADNYSLAVFARQVRHLLLTRSVPPFAGEAVLRTVTAAGGFIPVLLAGLIVGKCIVKHLFSGTEDRRELLLYQVALGWGAFSYIMLGLAASGLLTPAIIRSVTIVIIVIGLVQHHAWIVSSLRRMLFISVNRHIEKSRRESDSRLIHRLLLRLRCGTPAMSPFAWLMFLPLFIALIGALTPEVEYDALWYHLWLPRLWIEAARPVDIVEEYISLYPMTWELLYGAAMVWGNAVSAKLVHFACLPLVMLLVFRLVQRYWEEADPWLATAVFAVTPTVLWEATTAYLDLALSLYVGLAVYALLVYSETEKRGWLIAAGLSLGLALAIKHLALFVWVIAFTILWLWYGYSKGNWARATCAAALFAVGCLLLPLPWYGRNWVLTGNPFFPDLYQFFGAYPPERWGDITERGLQHFKDGFGRPRTFLNLILLPWDMTVHAARYGGSLGPIFLLLIPGLWFRCSRHSWPERALVALILGYLILWATPLSSFQMRFLVPLTPFLATLAAVGACRIRQLLLGSYSRLAFSVLLTGLLLLNLPPFMALHERDRGECKGWLTHVITVVPIRVVTGYQSGSDYLARRVRSYRAWQYINDNLQQNVLVLTFIGGDNFYSHRERLWSEATMAHPGTWGALHGREDQASLYLRQKGVTHLLLDRRQLTHDRELKQLAILQPEKLASYKLIYQDQHTILYELPIQSTSVVQ
jgi:hypothetical protein